jgi:hypothetical protein
MFFCFFFENVSGNIFIQSIFLGKGWEINHIHPADFVKRGGVFLRRGRTVEPYSYLGSS